MFFQFFLTALLVTLAVACSSTEPTAGEKRFGRTAQAYTLMCGDQLDIENTESGDGVTDSTGDVSREETFDDVCRSCNWADGEECMPGGNLGDFLKVENKSPESIKLMIVKYFDAGGNELGSDKARSASIAPGGDQASPHAHDGSGRNGEDGAQCWRSECGG